MADDEEDGPALPPSGYKHGDPEDGLECMVRRARTRPRALTRPRAFATP